MNPLMKYDPQTMTLDELVRLHLHGERIACPVCGAELQIAVAPRRTVFCPTDRKHFHIMPSTIADRTEIDRLLKRTPDSVSSADDNYNELPN
jgi:hypothetical protein